MKKERQGDRKLMMQGEVRGTVDSLLPYLFQIKGGWKQEDIESDLQTTADSLEYKIQRGLIPFSKWTISRREVEEKIRQIRERKIGFEEVLAWALETEIEQLRLDSSKEE